jgi:N-methylhydantoinase B
LVDDERLPIGTLVRIDTTGGGGWGDPLEREPERVALDVTQGKVSAFLAHRDYGVALVPLPDGLFGVDDLATHALRDELRSKRGFVPFFDRGPGYRLLSGRDYAELDTL